MKLESGPASGDRNYWLFVTVLCVAFSGWFIYDGAVGWPAENRAKAEEWAEGRMDPLPELGEAPTKEDIDRFRETGDSTVAELHETFGEPLAATATSRMRT